MCGSGAGTVLIGQLVTFLLTQYKDDWRSILKILSGLFLMTFLVVATYKPLKQKKVRVTDKKLLFEETDSESSQITIDFTKSKITMLPNILSVYTLSDDKSFESKRISM